jgi:RNA polymerase sigma-70 factor (ECF subfamily)
MRIRKDSCNKYNDDELIKKSLVEIDYFACLYNRYNYKLLRYIKRISLVGDEEAADILQESFIKMWRNLNNYDDSLKFSSWLYRIVRNETVSFYRKRISFGKSNEINIDDSGFEVVFEDADDEADIEAKRLATHEVLNKLPFKYKEVLILKFLEKMDYEEISDILKIPEGTVASRINRGKKMFKTIVDKEHISINS